MPSSLSTSNRMYFVTLHDYGEDDLLIEEMTGQEAMSQLFQFRLRLLSERDDIDPRRIIAKPAILRTETRDIHHMGGERHWNGVVSRFQRTGRTASPDGDSVYSYECDIVPWFWFLTQHEDCRIFQNKTVREIVEAIFEEFAYTDFRFDLTENHPSLEYCTQYHETTFDFISRLLEREGIHYYFRHYEEGGETRHLLVFSDNNGSNPALDPDTVPFDEEGHTEEFDAIQALALDQQMRTRKVTLGDWDFVRKRLLREDTPTVLSIGADRDLERYRYPGGFVEPALGKYRSRVIMEAEESSHMRFRGNGKVRTLAPGHTFTLEDHPFDEFNIEYMVLSVWHHGRNNLTGNGAPSDYANEFSLQPHEVTWRAPLSTPKGLVRGPQTALVTGPAGEEIHTDQYGRIKIQFHWDRLGRYDDRSSCWVRVAQTWAGNGFGTMFIPRVGMEVVVDFLEGDPDQPIVTGCVYNGINRPPYAPPARPGDQVGHQDVVLEGRRRLQRAALRGQEGQRGSLPAGGEGPQRQGQGQPHRIGRRRFQPRPRRQAADIRRRRPPPQGGWRQHHGRQGRLDAGQQGRPGTAFGAGVAPAREVLGADRQRGSIDIHGGLKLVMEANTLISLKVGGSGIVIDPSGVSVIGPIIKQNSGGAPSAASAPSGFSAEKAQGSHGTEDGQVTDPGQQLQAQALRNAALAGQPFCAECEAARAAYAALMA
ncbi:MAG: type VI secretion system tip protein VgrG [Thermomonas sp.]|nr:type VI secretion system tip protein VgrG [Thermomonas sp.]